MVRWILSSIKVALFVALGITLLCPPAGAEDSEESGKVIRNKFPDDEITALGKEGSSAVLGERA